VRREIKTYEWVCDLCGVVEETRRPCFSFETIIDLPNGWETRETPIRGGARSAIFQATLKHVCGNCCSITKEGEQSA